MCSNLRRNVSFHVVVLTLIIFVKFASPLDCRCGEKNLLEDRIIGGETVLSKKYPWIAYISLPHVTFCGGVLINDLYVLTADHCLEKETGLNFSVYLHTTHRTRNKGVKYSPVKIVRFENNPTSPSLRNDVALIKLNKRIDLGEDNVPICLPNPNSKYTHSNVSVLGWGLVGSGAASNLLQRAKLTVMSDEYCKSSSIGKHFNGDLMLCAYSNGTDSCKGDSGGPLIYNPIVNAPPKYELVGLVSWGKKCGHGAPGVYSKITHYAQWIISKTKDANYCAY